MSRTIDINRLLDEIGTHSRSASDPWTLSSGRNAITRDALNPGVLADIAPSPDDLAREIQSSRQIEQANALASSKSQTGTASSSQSNSGILQGLLNFFPFASGMLKLFGLGDDSAPQTLATYLRPPAVAFEGAFSGSVSELRSLSYGADGLPRVVNSGEHTIEPSVPVSGETVASPETPQTTSGGAQQADTMRELQLLASLSAGTTVDASQAHGTDPEQTPAGAAPLPVVTQLPGLMAEVGALAGTAFSPLESETSSARSLDFTPRSSAQDIGSYSPATLQGSPGAASGSLGSESAPTQQGAYGADRSNGQNILVQVHAMDSQSFLDHSQEIAQAVRQAMLNMHSLNDVISDL